MNVVAEHLLDLVLFLTASTFFVVVCMPVAPLHILSTQQTVAEKNIYSF